MVTNPSPLFAHISVSGELIIFDFRARILGTRGFVNSYVFDPTLPPRNFFKNILNLDKYK